MFEFWELDSTTKFKWNLTTYIDISRISSKLSKLESLFSKKKRQFWDIFLQLTMLFREHELQLAFTIINPVRIKQIFHKWQKFVFKKSNKPTHKEQTKLIPVELSWFPEWFSFCHLYVLCFGKKNDVCLLLADQEI